MQSVKKSSERSLPVAPSLNELPAAILFSLFSVTAIVMLPLQGLWDSNRDIVLLGITLLSLALLTWRAPKTRFATTVAMVVLTWQAAMAVAPQHLPEMFRDLGPQQLNSASAATNLLVLRVGMIAPAALMTLVSARRQMHGDRNYSRTQLSRKKQINLSNPSGSFVRGYN